MKYSILLSSIFLIILYGCDVLKSSNASKADLFGSWYQVESLDNSEAAPNLRVFGWHITDDEQTTESTFGAIFPLGINNDDGRLSLIDSQFLPSFTPRIHTIESDYFIVDYLDYNPLVSSVNSNSKNNSHSVSDLYVTRDTVEYDIISDQLILQGRYYSGIFQRADLGTQIKEPASSNFVVAIDEQEFENLKIAETIPSAYISRLSEDNIIVYSKMGGKNITIEIPDFIGPGSYTIDKNQAVYYTYGFDTLSPSYKTLTDSAGVITIEQFDMDNNRAIGSFYFTAHMGENESEPEFVKKFTNGSFDLPIY